MTDRPIIFSAPMVRALLDGRKSMTRRIGSNTWRKFHMDYNYRSIDGYQDYLAGRDGIIYSRKRGFCALKATPTSRGYPSVSLCGEDGIKTKYVHALVAAAWLGPRPSEHHEVRHLNSKRDDCRLANLDWATGVQNWGDRAALENGIHEQHHAAKITMSDAESIRLSTLSQRTIAKRFGISQSTVWNIKNDRIWVMAPQASGRNFALPIEPKLWVRETWAEIHVPHAGAQWIVYAAADNRTDYGGPWRSPIYMPRWASRLTLVVTATKIERVQSISEQDCEREGIYSKVVGVNEGTETLASRRLFFNGVDGEAAAEYTARRSFELLWIQINGQGSWDDNPEVIALTFTVHKQNIDAMETAA